jgi:hypothetical protein
MFNKTYNKQFVNIMFNNGCIVGIRIGISSISIFFTLGWKNVFGKCCWKVLGGIVILTVIQAPV